MKQTLSLIKIFFKETLMGMMNGMGKKGGKSVFLFLGVMLAVIMAALGYTFYNVASILNPLGFAGNILLVGFLFGIIMSLMITLTDTQGSMYKSQDYEMLASLPIRKVSIIFAKYISVYLITLLYFTAVVLPAIVIYFIYCGVTVYGVIYLLIAMLLAPTFSQFLNCIIGWFVNVVSSRMQNKTIMRTITTLILTLIVAVLIYLINTDMLSVIFATEMPLWFKIVFANIYFLFLAVSSGNFLWFLAFLAVSVLFAVLGVYVVTIGYQKVNTLLKTSRNKKKDKPLVFKKKSVFANLLKKETSTLFNNTVYCINCLMGPIMAIVVTVTCIIVYSSINFFPEAPNIIMPIYVFGVCMCLGIAPTTSVSVSMEGTKFQNLKCLPVSFKQIALSKICLNLIICEPVAIISALVFVCVVPVGIPCGILIVLYLMLAVLMYTVLGLLLNLRFPRLKWSNETQAAKQGASMLLTMFIDMFISILPMVLYFLISAQLEDLVFLPYIGIFIGVLAVLTIAIILLFTFKGKKLFEKINP
ncbi:MAG: hypothetical protein K2K31_00595 [Clostridia bacterium]|nr:hypothetical protein [Clostridia bacterium]